MVPGKSSFEYLRSLGSPAESIFTAPNAVDNTFFATQAENARAHAADFERNWNCRSRFILFVGRLVPEKGVFDLLEAYAKLESGLRSEVGLVFAGDGVSREELAQRAKRISPGTVCFPGFAQREDLAGLYALAEALVLPTHSDPWGLVVNEAMACGLPIIVSNVAGCSADLVEDGWNGYVVPPRDSEKLSVAIDSLVRQPELKQRMSARSSGTNSKLLTGSMRRWSGRGCDFRRYGGSMNSVKPLQWVGIVLGLSLALYFVYSHLQYFGNVSFLGGILLLEVIIASLWKYDQRFFVLLMIAFVWAGIECPPARRLDQWTLGRAVRGCSRWLHYLDEDYRAGRFGSLHLIAFFCVCAAFVSATVSPFIQMAFLKALSLFLLFLYCASGARLAVLGREDRFFHGLLWGCEIAVYLTAICYFGLGLDIWGNPNSLGAAMSIGVFPILLWGWLTSDGPVVKFRRLVALLLCAYLILFSMARAGMISVVLVTLDLLCLPASVQIAGRRWWHWFCFWLRSLGCWLQKP